MARTFDGTDDFIQFTLGNGNFDLGPSTHAAIVRRNADGGEHRIIQAMTSSSAGRHGLAITAADVLQLNSGATNSVSTTTVTVSSGWVLIAGAKAAGSATPRFHIYNYASDTWTHENGDIALTDGSTPGAGGLFNIGRGPSVGFFDGDVLIAGRWGSVLTDAQIETLAFSLQSWYGLNPAQLWLLDQSDVAQNVIDATGGGSNQTAITGTAVASSHPPIWNRHGHDNLVWAAQAAASFVPYPYPRRGMTGGLLE